MTRKYRPKRHKQSIKIISNLIDKNWSFDSETNMFTHPIYPNKLFKAICRNKKREQVNVFVDKFGKKHKKKYVDVISTLFPYISTDEDPKNLGYNVRINSSPYHFDIIPNKMQSFWDTRRGKRYVNYISYRKRRDAGRKLWIENNPKLTLKNTQNTQNNNSTNV